MRPARHLVNKREDEALCSLQDGLGGSRPIGLGYCQVACICVTQPRRSSTSISRPNELTDRRRTGGSCKEAVKMQHVLGAAHGRRSGVGERWEERLGRLSGQQRKQRSVHVHWVPRTLRLVSAWYACRWSLLDELQGQSGCDEVSVKSVFT